VIYAIVAQLETIFDGRHFTRTDTWWRPREALQPLYIGQAEPALPAEGLRWAA
jgi:hypothetical protein